MRRWNVDCWSWDLWGRMVWHLRRRKRKRNRCLLRRIICYRVRLPLLWLTLKRLWLPHRTRAWWWSTVGPWGAILWGSQTALLLWWATRARTMRRRRGIGGVMAVIMFAMLFPVPSVSAVRSMLFYVLLVVFVELIPHVSCCHELKSTKQNHVAY